MKRSRIAIGLVSSIVNLTVFHLAIAASDPDKDPRFAKIVAEADQLAQGNKSVTAIAQCDKVISAFKAYYGNERRKVYCGNTSAEVLGTLIEAAVKNQNSIVLSPIWANAYFVKGYALQDLHRLAEAKSNIRQALALSPTNSHYLNELGEIYQLEKNWPKAKKTFIAAEDNAPLAPDETRANDLAHARRGLGYVYVELGRLTEAEKKYRQCLATNPNDRRAADELRYVQQLRAKQGK